VWKLLRLVFLPRHYLICQCWGWRSKERKGNPAEKSILCRHESLNSLRVDTCRDWIWFSTKVSIFWKPSILVLAVDTGQYLIYETIYRIRKLTVLIRSSITYWVSKVSNWLSTNVLTLWNRQLFLGMLMPTSCSHPFFLDILIPRPRQFPSRSRLVPTVETFMLNFAALSQKNRSHTWSHLWSR
jgi:hypothetical protein